MGVRTFQSGIINGTSKDDNIQIARDVVTAMPFDEGQFFVQHKYAGQRLAYGYIYGEKKYGSITIQRYQGSNVVVDLEAGVYTIRS